MVSTITNFFKKINPHVFPVVMTVAILAGSLYKYPVNANSSSQQRTPEEQHRRNTKKSILGILGGGAGGGALVGGLAGGPYAPVGIVAGGLVGGLIARGVRKNKERRNGLRPVSREQSHLQSIPAANG